MIVVIYGGWFTVGLVGVIDCLVGDVCFNVVMF